MTGKTILTTFFNKSCTSHESTLSLQYETANTYANALKNSALKVCRFQNSALNLQRIKVDRLNLSRRASGEFAQQRLGYFYTQAKLIGVCLLRRTCVLGWGLINLGPNATRHTLFASELINTSYTF